MKKKNIIILSVLVIITITIVLIILNLVNNKTFFKETYVSRLEQEIFVPKYSYFKNECCMYAVNFYSLKSEKQLKKEIKKYLKDFEYFNDETTYGYRKDDLFIQSYEVVNHGLYRTIHITY